MKKIALRFGFIAVLLLLILEVSKYSLVQWDANEVAVVSIAFILILFGYFFRNVIQKSTLPKSEIIPGVDVAVAEQKGLSEREYQVLQLIAIGYSNQEIADQLFISLSTVKTHVSSILLKLNAKRRTQAVQNAKKYQILT